MRYDIYSFLFLLLFTASNSFALPEDLWVEHIERSTCEDDYPTKVKIKDKDWNDYPSVSCNGKCSDGTESAWQTPSEGMFSQEGMCGQTSIKNMLEMNCGVSFSIDTIDFFVRDLTPGVRPYTFKNGINEMKGIMLEEVKDICPENKYEVYRSRNGDDFISDLMILLRKGRGTGVTSRFNSYGTKVRTSPVSLFIQNPNRGFFGAHWVTVVDIEDPYINCTAIVNHWGKQYKVPCDDLKKMAKKGDQYPLVGAYTMVGLSNNKITD